MSGKISESSLEMGLNCAFEQANRQFEQEGLDYRVGVVEEKELGAKQPIFLQLVRNGEKIPIGITHFAKLTPDFEDVPFETVARTVDELATSIFKAIEIHEEVKTRPDVLITSAGTPFYSEEVKIEIREGILFLEGKKITFNEKPFEARRLCGEEGLTFVRLENGDFEVRNATDRRTGKGIFFNKDTGAIYRG